MKLAFLGKYCAKLFFNTSINYFLSHKDKSISSW